MGLEKDRAKFTERGAKIIALAVENQAEALQMVEKTGASYSILADANHSVADQYGVFDPSDGEANPAVFIINQEGQISWSYISPTDPDRPPNETILEHLP